MNQQKQGNRLRTDCSLKLYEELRSQSTHYTLHLRNEGGTERQTEKTILIASIYIRRETKRTFSSKC